MNPKVSRKKEMRKLRAEINYVEIKKTAQWVGKTKSYFSLKEQTKLTDFKPDS